MGNDEMLIFLNLLICSSAGWLCICRFTKMSHRTTKFLMRVQYVVWFTVLFASGWSRQLFDAVPNIPQIVMGVAIFGYLLMGAPAWKRGLPEYARRTVDAR